MNLIIDIGNTNAKVAVFDGNEMLDFSSSSNKDLNLLDSFLEKYSIEHCIVASVINIPEHLIHQLQKCSFSTIYLDKNTPLPIVNLYKTPQTLGYDRIAAVIGANAVAPNRDLLVIDAGTCITYEYVDAKNQYHGGNISPGLHMRLKALNYFTGKLPLVEAENDSQFWGDTTETAIRAGVWKGIEFEICGYIKELRNKFPQLLVFLTGGDRFSFDESIKNIIFADRFLVLKGLNRILNYNNGRI